MHRTEFILLWETEPHLFFSSGQVDITTFSLTQLCQLEASKNRATPAQLGWQPSAGKAITVNATMLTSTYYSLNLQQWHPKRLYLCRWSIRGPGGTDRELLDMVTGWKLGIRLRGTCCIGSPSQGRWGQNKSRGWVSSFSHRGWQAGQWLKGKNLG